MNIDKMHPSRWLKASDAGDGDLVLTIRDIVSERIGQGSQSEDKWVLRFHGEDRGLVLNKTNSNTIAKLYGSETDGWIGKRIALFATEVQFGSDMVEALRVRSKPPGKPGLAAMTAVAAPATNADDPDCPF